jgi:hypothetical protein
LSPTLRDDLDEVVENPGAVEAVDAGPQAGGPKSLSRAIWMKPWRAAVFWSAGMASSRLPSTTSTFEIRSGTLARIFSTWGGTKWIMRSSCTGSSRKGAGAPIARGW